jgi:hypothetical protein
MKKIIDVGKKLALIVFIGFISSCYPVAVAVRPGPPPPPIVVRPLAPFPGTIWIEGEYVWSRRAGAYVIIPGYWARPRARGYWVPGHWAERRGGSFWVHGYWR